MKNDRKFELVLYPDSISYDCNEVLLKAQAYFDFWAFILHNKDVDEDNLPKKPHYHFIGRKYTMLTPKGVCYQLGVVESALANIKNWKSAVRYLVHADTPDKHPYEVSEVSSNFDVAKIICGSEDDDAQAAKIFKHIMENPHEDLSKVVDWCMANGLWSAFRRGFAVWSKLIGGLQDEGYRYPQSRY